MLCHWAVGGSVARGYCLWHQTAMRHSTAALRAQQDTEWPDGSMSGPVPPTSCRTHRAAWGGGLTLTHAHPLPCGTWSSFRRLRTTMPSEHGGDWLPENVMASVFSFLLGLSTLRGTTGQSPAHPSQGSVLLSPDTCWSHPPASSRGGDAGQPLSGVQAAWGWDCVSALGKGWGSFERFV